MEPFVPLSAGENTMSAPNSSSRRTRSSLALSGITTVRRYPLRRATMARAMPVLPEVGSRMTLSGVRRPSRSASSTMRLAMRSLSEPVGFCPSSLAHRRTPGFGDSRGMPTSGVFPMASRMSLARMARRLSQGGATVPGRRRLRTNRGAGVDDLASPVRGDGDGTDHPGTVRGPRPAALRRAVAALDLGLDGEPGARLGPNDREANGHPREPGRPGIADGMEVDDIRWQRRRGRVNPELARASEEPPLREDARGHGLRAGCHRHRAGLDAEEQRNWRAGRREQGDRDDGREQPPELHLLHPTPAFPARPRAAHGARVVAVAPCRHDPDR